MATPKLNFRIGDETKPKIEDIEKNDIQTTFFYEVYQKAFRLIDDILSTQNNTDPLNNDESQIRNNIIAFVGDRGSGKTSSMKTIYKMLINNNTKLYEDICKKLIDRQFKTNEPIFKKFAELPVIDPSYFEDKTNLVEIVVTHMFSKFKKRISDPNEETDTYSSEFQGKKQDLINRFQRVKDCLDTIHGETYKTDDSIDSLVNLADGIHLKDELNLLINAYLKFFKCDILIIAIDDIDLHTTHAYQMVEQMRKYLIQPNVIILAGVKISQLNDLVKQHYYRAHKDLIDKDNLSDTIEDMSGRYLSKLFPLNQRVMMPDLNQRWNCEIQITKEENEQKEGNEQKKDSILQTSVKLIFEKTQYMFYCAENNPPLIIPRNLRDLLNFISFLYQMSDLPKKENDNSAYIAQLDQNRRLFKNYFINTWCREHLSNQMFTFIKDLETTDITDINKSVIDFLTQISENKDIRLEKTITYKANKGHNVSLGDAMYVLDKTSNNQTIPYIHHFTAAIKTFYTFLLSDLVDEELTDRFYDKFQSGEAFKSTPNSNQIPIQLKKLNKLNKLSDYEKLLGGNVIRVARLLMSTSKETNQSQERNGGRKEDNASSISKDASHDKDLGKEQEIKHPFIHLHLINIDPIESIHNSIHNKEFFLLEKFDLNIFEFLVLTSYVNTDNSYFRSQRHCPYYATLDDEIINLSNPIVYSSTAILFNIVKIYDLYRIFRCEYESAQQKKSSLSIKEGQDDKITWRVFFTYIDEKSKYLSLIYRLLHFKKEDKEDKKQAKFSNSYIENLLIRNMDTYDALMDYLPFMKSQYKKDEQQDKYFGNLLNFYKKLAEFQYYEYSVTTDYKSISFEALTPVAEFLGAMTKEEKSKQMQDRLKWELNKLETQIPTMSKLESKQAKQKQQQIRLQLTSETESTVTQRMVQKTKFCSIFISPNKEVKEEISPTKPSL